MRQGRAKGGNLHVSPDDATGALERCFRMRYLVVYLSRYMLFNSYLEKVSSVDIQEEYSVPPTQVVHTRSNCVTETDTTLIESDAWAARFMMPWPAQSALADNTQSNGQAHIDHVEDDGNPFPDSSAVAVCSDKKAR